MTRLALALVLTLASPAGAAADEPTPRVDSRPPLHEDAAPQGRTIEERLDEIRRRVQAAASYPPLARLRDQTGETWVAFTVAPDGSPDGVTTFVSSGSTALDRAAERAVQDAAPLPRVYGLVRVPVRFALRPGE